MNDMTMSEACAHLEFRFPGLEMTGAGGLCPLQAEGTLYGAEFYFRFRHGWAELRIQSQEWFQPLYMAGTAFGEHEDQGWLEPPEFVEVMTQLIGKLERAPILWEFEGVEPEDAGVIKAGTPAKFGAWGHTPEEAWASMHEPSQWLLDKGISADRQAQWLAARQMNPQTITVDTRVYPDPDPFAALAA